MDNHNFFYTFDGLFVFGCNKNGQLGLGDRKNRKLPTKLIFDYEIISIECGGEYTIINTTDGVFVCGYNKRGQLGLGDKKDRYMLTKLDFFKSGALEIISISCGCSHTIINTTDGLFVFGANFHGQLGLGDTYDRKVPTKLEFGSLIDQGCSIGKSLEILSIHCGGDFTIINTTEGLFVFGDNFDGQLGLGDYKNRKLPTKLEFFKDLEIISICCGFYHTIINTTDGLFVFGYNFHGQLGLGDRKERSVPTKLEFFKSLINQGCSLDGALEILSIYCGRFCTMINTIDGVFVFGDNIDDKLGLCDNENILVPTKLKLEHELISIHCSFSHIIINTIDGLFGCGSNCYGQLGLGDTRDRKELTKINFNYKINLLNQKKQIKSTLSFHNSKKT